MCQSPVEHRHETGRRSGSRSISPQIERLYMPAMPPLWLFALIGRALARWRKRRAVKALLKRDDHILCDLGYSRGELRRQLGQPGLDVSVRCNRTPCDGS
ncbi:hypothetical protein [Salinisphaera sp. T5B8]|uniref:DUF1127 domain-containing protein n=1 Tax=Salinisphaera sp. T5B8 TaxID=1304154 RepID=UPI0033408EB3